MNRRGLVIAPLAVLFLTILIPDPQAGAAGLPDERIIVAVLDLTPSFHYTAEAVGKIKGVVRALGPGDTFLLVTLGGEFSPARNVAVQCIMPKIGSDALVPAENIRVWREHQSRIEAAWGGSALKQAAVLRALDRPFKQENVTPLYQALDYLSHWFASPPGSGRRQLLIFSDLEHDYAGVRSSLPPKQQMNFRGVYVMAAFVPWRADWVARETAWHAWLASTDFTMLDEARARVAVMVDLNGTPHAAPKRF
jgi:hypothetical protein